MKEVIIIILIIYIIECFRIKYKYAASNKILGMVSTIYTYNNFTWKNIKSDLYKQMTGNNIASGNYASDVINQHKSSWCGCCYMVSVVQMLQDRTHIALGKNKQNSIMIPWVVFDLQDLLDSYQAHKGPYTDGWNACKGGLPLHVLNAIENGYCPLLLQSKNSVWLGHPRNIKNKQATNLNLKIENSRRIVPTKDVEKCIIEKGPVVLTISAQTLIDIDQNGYAQCTEELKPNHAVSVIGWKYNNGKKYWIVRNSWGEKQVPKSLPDDMSCVTVDGNDCQISMKLWTGDVNNPGYIYVPVDFRPLNDDTNSPWFEADVILTY